MGRRALVLVVALLLAGVAAFAIFRYLSGVEDEILQETALVEVYRSNQLLAEGTQGSQVLSNPDVLFKLSEEEARFVPTDAITTEEQLRASLTGKVAAGPISANQILTQSQWTEITVQITPLAELIPVGKQALTISPGNIQGVNGFVNPGDRVNVIVTLDIEFRLLPTDAPDFGIPIDQGQTGQDQQQNETVTLTRFVLQGLPVLAVGAEPRPEEDAPETVDVVDPNAPGAAEGAAPPAPSTVFTLEVTPEQAERLVYAQENGSIYLTLVPEDFVEVATKGITIETLFEGDLVEDIFGG